MRLNPNKLNVSETTGLAFFDANSTKEAEPRRPNYPRCAIAFIVAALRVMVIPVVEHVARQNRTRGDAFNFRLARCCPRFTRHFGRFSSRAEYGRVFD